MIMHSKHVSKATMLVVSNTHVMQPDLSSCAPYTLLYYLSQLVCMAVVEKLAASITLMKVAAMVDEIRKS
jgi:hypothetical protein